ncbi:MAG: hypothetical protein ACKO3T_03815 [Planctomycetaceae bacterium]
MTQSSAQRRLDLVIIAEQLVRNIADKSFIWQQKNARCCAWQEVFGGRESTRKTGGGGQSSQNTFF